MSLGFNEGFHILPINGVNILKIISKNICQHYSDVQIESFCIIAKQPNFQTSRNYNCDKVDRRDPLRIIKILKSVISLFLEKKRQFGPHCQLFSQLLTVTGFLIRLAPKGFIPGCACHLSLKKKLKGYIRGVKKRDTMFAGV